MKMVYVVALLFCCVLEFICITGCSTTTEAYLIKTVPDALLYGGWRTCRELINYNGRWKRDSLIVELMNVSTMNVQQLQAKESSGRIFSLVGMAAIYICLRDMKIKSIEELESMSDREQRDTLIVELYKSPGSESVPILQAKSDLELVRLAVSKL